MPAITSNLFIGSCSILGWLLLLLSAACPFLGRFTRCARLVVRRQTFVRRCQKLGERRDRRPWAAFPVRSEVGGRRPGAPRLRQQPKTVNQQACNGWMLRRYARVHNGAEA